MNGARLRHFPVLFLTLLLCSPGLLLACAAHKSVPSSKVNEVQIKTTDPLEDFAKEFEAISKKVEEGSLPAEAINRATEIQIDLNKYLIKAEAELEILRLDVLHGGDDQRERALNQMVELVEKREQTKISYLKELRAVSKPSEDKTVKSKKGKDFDIDITIAPENIGDGERP
jgi:uncharacterized FAD-dependent dehydrogenase